MASAKDLMNKLGGTGGGGGFLKKPAPKSLIANPDEALPSGEHTDTTPKHFDPSQKGHNVKKGGSGGGGSVLSNVRPKV